jgi:hypothetical protein
MKTIWHRQSGAAKLIIAPLLGGILLLSAHGVANGADAGTLVDSDFGACPVAVSNPLGGDRTGSFKGVLPTGWRDDFSGWSKSHAESRVMTEDGKSFWRLSTAVASSGKPQFAITVPELRHGECYRLSVRARNRSEGPITLGIRIVPQPYEFRFQRQVGFSSDWTEKSWLFKLDNPTGAPLGIFLLATAGEIDIATIKLETATLETLMATIVRPDPAVKNLFRNSRLPLGLQAGWNLNRANPDIRATPDAADLGPSGAPALKIETPTEGMLFSEPFQVANPAVKNRAALSFKGTGKWRIAILQDGKDLASKNLEPTDDWKRDGIAFTADPMAKSFSLMIVGSGTLWIDALAAWSGDEDRPYVSAGDCEVALALPASEIAETRIQFEDEPARLAYCVTGNWRNAVLKTKATNVFGAEKALPDIDLGSDSTLLRILTFGLAGKDDSPRFLTSGTLDFDVFPETPYGQFRIEAWVERDGQRISPFNEAVVTRVRRPVFWGEDAPDSPFGAHFLSVDRTIKAMKAGGINWARLHDAGFEYIGWWWLEPEKGQWTFFDADIHRYRANQVKIFAQLGTAPKWASYLSKVDTGREWISYHDRYFQPLSLDDFANYAKTVAARYRGVIDEYFVWNEPWIQAWWGVAYDKTKPGTSGHITSEHPQADFAALMKAAYQAVKAVDPDAKVSGFNTTAGKNGAEWTRGVLDAGGLASCDLIDYHCYVDVPQGFPGSSVDQAHQDAIGYIVEKAGPLGKPVYMSEGQAGSNGSASGDTAISFAGLYKHTLPYASEEDSVEMADLTCKYILSLLANHVDKVFLYSAHCYRNLGAPSNFNVLLCGDGYPHPSLAAHSTLAWHVENKTFVKVVPAGSNAFAYVFAGKDGGSLAIISGKANGTFAIPASDALAVTDVFGNPLPRGAEFKGTLVYVASELSAAELEQACGLD